MITQEYINGYINALNTLEESIKSDMEHIDLFNEEGLPYSNDEIDTYNSVLNRIKNLKDAYKDLVKKLNESVHKNNL